MANLIKMDLYRMTRIKTFYICLILAFVLAFSVTPLQKGLFTVASMISPDETISIFPSTAKLSDIIENPFPFMTAMLLMISICAFFYSDVENGYIKNIAGQMPKKGYSILSRFLSAFPHNLAFLTAGVTGNLLGTLIVQHVEADSAVLSSIGAFFLKLLLIQSICAILVLFVSCMRNKSLGTVIAVIMGLPLLGLIYGLIDAGIQKLIPDIGPIFSEYMPDQVMRETYPDALKALAVAAIITAVFLTAAIRVFDRKDVT